jgi:hypothetical protein
MAYLFSPQMGSLDAFARYRISSPETVFDSKQLGDNQPLYWDDAVISGGGTSSTYNANQASTTLAVSNLTAGVRARQTFRAFNYQPGKSQLVIMTGALGANATGIRRRIGQFNTNNGLFFEQDASVLSVVRRTFTSGGVVNNAVTQANWNLDKMDGSGPSGVTINPALTQIFFFDYEWLGVGSVRFGFFINGVPIYCHRMDNANVLSLVYMSLPNLPLRYEISNDGTGPVASLVHICSSVISEGGQQDTGFDFGVDRGSTVFTTLNDADIYPLLAIRLKSAFQWAQVKIHEISIVCTSTSTYRWALLLNPTVAGVALAFTGITNSAVEADLATTNATKVTGGTQLVSGYNDSSAAGGAGTVSPIATTDLQLGASIAGVSDILVLAVQRVVGAAETFYASLAYNETK